MSAAATWLRRWARDERGSAAEFALVLPLALLFFFGIIDAGRYAYSFNQGEKATQTGTRFAVVTDPVATAVSQSFLDVDTSAGVLAQGDRIPADALPLVSCDTGGCDDGGTDAAARGRLVARMQQIWPAIEDANVVIDYEGSGLGYAGNPDGLDIAPFVTVRLTGMEFTSILLFGANVGFPDFAYTLTMEDGTGTGSN